MSSTASAPPLPSPCPNISFIRTCLHQQLRVSLSDGRIVEGTLECFDDSGNIILSCTTDVSTKVKRRRGAFVQQTYRMGTVLVPGDHQVSILLRRRQSFGGGREVGPLNRMGELGRELEGEEQRNREELDGGDSEGDGE